MSHKIRQKNLAELTADLIARSKRRQFERRLAALISLILTIVLVVAPKPEEPPLWLTLLFVILVLTLALSVAWVCRGLNEDIGFSASISAPIFKKFLEYLEGCETIEAIQAILDIWPALSSAQRNTILPMFYDLLVLLDTAEAAQLSKTQKAALEDTVLSYPHTDCGIMGLLTLSRVQHEGEKLRPLAETWANDSDRLGTAAQEYLASLEIRHR